MGIHLNPGNECFAEIVDSKIYVDKSMMIAMMDDIINDWNKYICVSCPSCFGKTITGNMLSAYYSKGCDSHRIFDQLKISKAEGYGDKLNKYIVIKIDMNSEYQEAGDKTALIRTLEDTIQEEMRKEFPEIDILNEDSLAKSILKVYSETGEQFIIIIDEYDVLVREQVEESLLSEYLSFLSGLFKSETLRSAIAFAYLTGMLPAVKDKIQGRLNNLEGYTMLEAGKFTEYMGFTEDEVKNLCVRYGMDFEECRRWYGGYDLDGFEIYNPESVVKSMIKGEYGFYRSEILSHEIISDWIRQNHKGLKDYVLCLMAGKSVDVNVGSFLNTMNSFACASDMLTYLIHLGYLAYDQQEEICRIPNEEIRMEWMRIIKEFNEYEIIDF